jgi:S1-C subfamily serine protease
MAADTGIPGNPLKDFSAALVQAVERAAEYTVMVNARRRRPASGVAYSPNLVLTADHVIEREEDIHVLTGAGLQVQAVLTGRDPASDLALLRLEGAELPAAPAAAAQGAVGTLALTVARPDTQGVQSGLALISAVGGPVRTMRGGLLKRYYRLDATPLPGFSGGPLVDSSGAVLGINTSGLAMGIFLSLPTDLAWETAALLARDGRIKRGYLGVRSQPVEIPPAARALLDRKQESGLLLVNVEENSPAGQAGLMVGDTLVALGGRVISEPDDLMLSLAAESAGRTVPVQVIRAGKLVTLDVKIGER